MTTNWMLYKYSNKYKILKIKVIWEAPQSLEEKPIALEANFYELRKRMASKKREVNEDANKKSTKKKNKGKIKERKEKPYWMFQGPEEQNLNETMEWNGSTCNF